MLFGAMLASAALCGWPHWPAHAQGASQEVSQGMSQGMAERDALTQAQLIGLLSHAAGQAAQQVMKANPDLRVETQVGAFPPQLKLAPCQVAQPHLNPGAKAWGDMRIGLRCLQGPVRWNVYVPATIRVFGPAWVAASHLPAGHVLTQADMVRQEAEISAEAGALPTDVDGWKGRSLTSAVRGGQVLRVRHLRTRQWFAAGESVTLVARGPGFAVTSEGVAMSPGLEGQPTPVRLDSGRVVQGKAVGARRVEVSL